MQGMSVTYRFAGTGSCLGPTWGRLTRHGRPVSKGGPGRQGEESISVTHRGVGGRSPAGGRHRRSLNSRLALTGVSQEILLLVGRIIRSLAKKYFSYYDGAWVPSSWNRFSVFRGGPVASSSPRRPLPRWHEFRYLAEISGPTGSIGYNLIG